MKISLIVCAKCIPFALLLFVSFGAAQAVMITIDLADCTTTSPSGLACDRGTAYEMNQALGVGDSLLIDFVLNGQPSAHVGGILPANSTNLVWEFNFISNNSAFVLPFPVLTASILTPETFFGPPVNPVDVALNLITCFFGGCGYGEFGTFQRTIIAGFHLSSFNTQLGNPVIIDTFGFFLFEDAPIQVSLTQIPVPTILPLMALTLAGLGFQRRKAA